MAIAATLFTRLVLSSLAMVLVPLLGMATLTNAAPERRADRPLEGWEILHAVRPERAEDVTGTRIAEAISNEDPLTLRFAGLELGDDRFLICEADAFDGVDFSIWSVSARGFVRLAQAEDIDGRRREIERTCGKALEKIEAIS